MKTIASLFAFSAICLFLAIPATAQSPQPGTQPVQMTIHADGATNAAQPAAVLDIDKKVGEEVCFTLTAKDKNGNIIRSWKTSGNATTLTLQGSTANTDTSNQSWNDDPQGYSWATITFNGTELTKISANEWSIPASDFDDGGQARVCLIHTKAERGVTISVTPLFQGLNQVTEKMNFSEGAITNFLVELTSQTTKGNQIFHMRAYEIVVSPRDRYLNISTETIKARFSARYPGEFDSHIPGLSDIFSGEVFITGTTNYLLASRIVRELPNDDVQWLVCYSVADNRVWGRTSPYEVLSHAPVPFNLLAPADHYIFVYDKALSTLDFTWERPNPPDPYTNIQISRFNPALVSDDVYYTWTIVDSMSLTRAINIASNSSGTVPTLTMSHAQISNIVYTLSGSTTVAKYNGVWYVTATDGLYNTLSSPPNKDANGRPGYHIFMDVGTQSGVKSTPVPAAFGLRQNYPNPFNPSTNIAFSIPRDGRVVLTVHDLLGAPVATLVNEELEAGQHTLSFNALSLPSGTYIYKLQFDGRTLTRRMTLMK
jgi:hypothetical protein